MDKKAKEFGKTGHLLVQCVLSQRD